MIKLPKGYCYIDEWRTDITSPAFTNPSRGEVHINHPVFDRLTPDQQNFIILHELAHRYTEDEFTADYIAFCDLMKIKNSPKIAPDALFHALSGIIPEHEQRYLQMLATAANYDIKVNGNTNAKEILKLINHETMAHKIDEQTENQIIDALVARGYTEDEVLDAIVELEADDNGIYYASDKKAERQAKKEEKKAARQAKKEEKKAKKEERKERKAEAKTKRQEAKAEKAELKNQAKQARIDRKNKLADARANKINAKAEGIANGTYDPMGNLMSGAANIVGKFTGAGDEDGYVEEEKSNLPLILGIGGGVLVLIVVIVLVMMKKK